MSNRYSDDYEKEFFIPASQVPAMRKAVLDKFSAYENWENVLLQDQQRGVIDPFKSAVGWNNWEMSFDEEGNATSLSFPWDLPNLGEDLLEVISPFVKDGSYIQLSQESDSFPIRIILEKGTYHMRYPKVEW